MIIEDAASCYIWPWVTLRSELQGQGKLYSDPLPCNFEKIELQQLLISATEQSYGDSNRNLELTWNVVERFNSRSYISMPYISGKLEEVI